MKKVRCYVGANSKAASERVKLMDKLTGLIRNKSFTAAEKLLRKKLDATPNNGYLLTQLANVLWNRCKDDEALHYAN